jgi:hypothetical protein
MEIPIQLTARGLELTPDEEAMIRGAADGLERYFGRLIGCRVVVSVPHRRPGGEPIAWSFGLSLTVPGDELVVTRQAKPTFREALDDAFDAARRRVQDYAREVRGDVKARAATPRGVTP